MGKSHPTPPPIDLRSHRPGDMGWVIQRHGELYHQEFGWDCRFEALVARVAADFIDHFDPQVERCWIAESEGRRVGSVFLVRGEHGAAKLRLLLVDPQVRNSGLGRRLVRECIHFAAGAGYTHLTLWTNHVLLAARRLYTAQGFHLVSEEPHHSFGHELVGEYWERALESSA